jgi:transposase InsO family protein
MRRLDELHLEFPFAGSRMLRGLLAAELSKVGRRHVTTLMRRMGIEAIYRRPNKSKPAPGPRIYAYLLRGLTIDRPNHVWATDITYIPMARGFVYLAAVMDWFARRVLAWRLSNTNRLQQRLQAHALPHQLHIRKTDLSRRRSRHGSTLLALQCADPHPLQSLDIAWASLHQQVLQGAPVLHRAAHLVTPRISAKPLS